VRNYTQLEIKTRKFILIVRNNANVLYGETTLQGWQIKTKTNSVLGRISGDRNLIANRLNLLNGPDLVDMALNTPES